MNKPALQQQNKLIELKKRLRSLQNEYSELRDNQRILIHDIKTPISSILLVSESLLDEMDELSQSEVEVEVQKIVDLSKEMYQMVRRLLEEDRVKQEKKQIRSLLAPLLVQEAVEIVQDRFAQKSNAKRISFISDPTIFKGLCWIGEKELLDMILSNLVSNALKYSPAGTTVTFAAEQDGPMVKLHVIDQGLGLTSEDMSKLFQSYAQIESSPTGSESKTGLGLYVAQQMANRMQGKVMAHSDGKNKGSVFSICLPVAGVASST
ncbi:MAG: HAMP domain-containing sensor histidine kinase [Chloroflexota bacterium]